MFIFYMGYNTTHGYFLKPRTLLSSHEQGYKYPILLDLNSVSVKEPKMGRFQIELKSVQLKG